MPTLTYSKFEGDREAKTCDVLLDGEVVGVIEVHNDEEFQGRATMRRTMRFSEVIVALTGKWQRHDREASFSAVDGYTRQTGVRAAKTCLQEWLLA